MQARPVVLGVTDDVTTCGCCGKKGLRVTVALDFGEAEPRHYGRDCAGMALFGGTRSADKARTAETIARDFEGMRRHQDHGGRYPLVRNGWVVGGRTTYTYRVTAAGVLELQGMGWRAVGNLAAILAG